MKRLIEFFIDSPVAANLLAGLLVVFGILAGSSLVVRLFPETNLYAVNVTIPYPGASPDEVEEGIVIPVEEQLEGLEGVRKITSVAAENRANIVVDLYDGEDTNALVNDVRTEIGQITVFPAQAEEPQITELETDELTAQIILSGNIDPINLKKLAQETKSRLVATDAISQVDIVGVPDYLIDISVSEAQLQALGLSLPQLAQIVGSQSVELSGGQIETNTQRALVRTLGENETGAQFEEIIITRSQSGSPVRLGDIADIEDGLAEDPVDAALNGTPAVALKILRVGDERVFDIIEAVETELVALEDRLPDGVSATLWRDESENLQGRISLLMRNAASGLLLVTILLLLFLDLRIAFWVAVGVSISFIGALILMQMFGIAISQLSLFGFILAIGIVVDDAIVVGENVYSEIESGRCTGKEAVRRGTLRVVRPVLFSVSTTILAFLPLLFLPGIFGQFLSAIAAVVIFVLFMSLVESFLILPRHLSHISDKPPGRYDLRRITDPARDWVTRNLDAFSDNRLRPAICFSVLHPLVTIMAATGILFAVFGFFASGYIKFVFFPPVEGNYLTAEIELAEAASENETRKAINTIVDAGYRAADEVAQQVGAAPDEVLTGILWSLGQSIEDSGPSAVGASGGAAANKAFITLRMQDAAIRKFTATQLKNAWAKETGDIPGAQTLSFSADLVGSEADVSLKIAGNDEERAREVVTRLRQKLDSFPGALSVRDDRFRTTDEIQIELLPAARALDVTLEQVATQVRAAYFGSEAVRIQRDREEIEVRLRYTEEERSSLATILNQRININGQFIPLSQLAEITVGDAPSIINREDGRRVFSLEADADFSVTTGGQISNYVLNEAWPAIQDEYPDVVIFQGGEQEEQIRTQEAMQRNFLIAIFAIYALLALAFGSYVQPFVILCIIPFGLIGAILGHALLGLNITLLSLFGIIGLSGVIINDALLMIDFINEDLERGEDRVKAIVENAVGRFRPIILTSMTTFLGVTPIILEQSVQAAFLVPTAVSLGFGILIGTAVLMLVVPAAASLHGRTKGWVKRQLSRLNTEPSRERQSGAV